MEAGAGATTTRAIASTSEGQERARRFATKVAATARRASLRDTGHVHDAPTAYQNADRPVLTSLFESNRRFVRLRRRALVWDLGHLLATPTRARPYAPSVPTFVSRSSTSRERARTPPRRRGTSPRNLAAEFQAPTRSDPPWTRNTTTIAGRGTRPPPPAQRSYPYDDHGAGGVGSKRGRSPSRYPPGDPGYDDDRRRSPQRSPSVVDSTARPREVIAAVAAPAVDEGRALQRRRRGLIFPRVLPPAHVRPRHPLGVRARVRAVQSQQRGKLPQARFRRRPRRREDEGARTIRAGSSPASSRATPPPSKPPPRSPQRSPRDPRPSPSTSPNAAPDVDVPRRRRGASRSRTGEGAGEGAAEGAAEGAPALASASADFRDARGRWPVPVRAWNPTRVARDLRQCAKLVEVVDAERSVAPAEDRFGDAALIAATMDAPDPIPEVRLRDLPSNDGRSDGV